MIYCCVEWFQSCDAHAELLALSALERLIYAAMLASAPHYILLACARSCQGAADALVFCFCFLGFTESQG